MNCNEKRVLIRVGHPAYQGTNAMRLCFSKAQAVRVLRNRGVRRDSAREAIERALEVGGSSVNANILESIEISNHDHPMWNGYFTDNRKELMRIWRNRPE